MTHVTTSRADTEWTDMSLTIHPDMEKMDFLPCPSMERLSEQSDTSLQVTNVSVSTHIGTHMDAAAHALADGMTIDEYAVDRGISSAAIASVDVGSKEPIQVDDVIETGLSFDESDGLIIHTGWEKKAGNETYADHPYFTTELARWITDRQFDWVGIDFLTPDRPPELRPDKFDYPVHTELLNGDVVIIENLTNIGTFETDQIEVAALPVKLADCDGAPMRVAGRPEK